MSFLYSPLTWGFLAVLAPLLIHLINMLRHRRVRWAAMDFLLQSYRKHRKWVWLKQLLLLASRMAVIALLVAMLAQWITRGQWLDLLGGRVTHHYVLIDDSYSMSDRRGGRMAFDEALQFVQRLGSGLSDQQLPQKFTMIRFSRAAAPRAEGAAQRVTDMNAVDIDGRFPQRLEETRNGMEVTQLGSGPLPALQLLEELMRQGGDENRQVYLVSDFRGPDWENPAEIRGLLRQFEEQDADVRFVACVDDVHPNLAVTRLIPSGSTRAAGVPLDMEISVRNYGPQPAVQVPLTIRTHTFETATAPSDGPRSSTDQLPVLIIDRIEPGETVTRRAPVIFDESGHHAVEASLPEDSVAADNRRWCAVEFPEGEPVLIIDADLDQRNAFFLERIFAPGPRAETGIRPDVHGDPAILAETPVEQLLRYNVIYLCDVTRLEDRALENLEAYVQQGGGLAVFVGPQVSTSWYNGSFYANGTGLFPAPLDRVDLLPLQDGNPSPDVEIALSAHPVFRDLRVGRNPIVTLIHIDQYYRLRADWEPPEASSVVVPVQLRTGEPLVVEQRFGEGRVVAFLTTFGPYWNDWVLGPNVLVALNLQSYLGSSRRPVEDRLVGGGWQRTLPQDLYRPQVRFFVPDEDPVLPPQELERTANSAEGDDSAWDVGLTTTETARSGIYEVWMDSIEDEQVETVRTALNVPPEEGNLQLADRANVLSDLEPVRVEFLDADAFGSGLLPQSGFNRSMLLMCLLIGLLLFEQWLAYSASYHPARGAVR